MRSFTDEQLTAYADGELPAVEVQAIAEAARADAALARRIERFAGTRRVLERAFAATLDEPMPARLRELLDPASDKVVPLRRPVAARAPRWMPAALAASVALAVGLSLSNWWPGRGADAVAIAGLPPDAAALQLALESSASGVPVAGAAGGVRYEILPTSTLRTAQGGYCREFESSLPDSGAQARGLACRGTDGAWATVAVATVGAAAAPGAGPDGYVPAAGDGPDFAAALGRPARLTPAEEQALISQHWSKSAP